MWKRNNGLYSQRETVFGCSRNDNMHKESGILAQYLGIKVYTSEINACAKQHTLCMNAAYKHVCCGLHTCSLRNSETVHSYLLESSSMNVILQSNCELTAMLCSLWNAFVVVVQQQKNGTCSEIIILLKLHLSKY